MTRLLAIGLLAFSVAGCSSTRFPSDYCADSHPVHLRQTKPEWEANYRTCRMIEAAMRSPRPSIDVFVYRGN